MKKAHINGLFKPILTVDSARCTIINFNQKGEVVFELPTYGASFESWLLGTGNYLYCYLSSKGHGIQVVTPENEIITDYKTDSEVFSCQPLDNGYVLVGELTEKRITIIAPNGRLEKIIPVKSATSGHEVMRSARKLRGGEYLVVHPGDCVIRQYDGIGTVLWEAKTRPNTFGAVERKNGNIIYTSQTALVELDISGNEIWTFEASDAPQLGIHWLTGLHLLSNGNIVVCNWLGHGMEGAGIPLFEVNNEKQIIWSLAAHEFTSNLANVQALNENPYEVATNVMK